MFILKRFLFCLFIINLLQSEVSAQKFGNTVRSVGRSNASAESTDSLQKRDQNADSITLFYKLYNNNDIRKLDSSINDFFVHYPLPYTNYNLGNLGTATKSYLFSTQKK